MATNSNSVDLVIRAKDLTSKTLDELQATLGRLTGGLDELEAAGGPATRTFRELSIAADDFKKVANELTARRGLAEQFLEAGKAAEQARAGVTQAQDALKAFQGTLEAGKRKTEDQKNALNALNRALKEQEAQLRSAERAEAAARRGAEQRGISIQELVDGYDALVAAEKRADDASVRAEANVRRRDEAARQAAAQRKADAEDEANSRAALARLEAGDAELQARALAERRAVEEQLAQSLRDQAAAERDAAERREKLRLTSEALLNQRLQEVAQQERVQASLRELAAEAERAATATQKVSTAQVKPEPVRKLADEMRALVDPASQAVQSLAAVEGTLRSVEALQAKAAKGAALGADEVKALANGYTFLGSALKTVQGQAGLVDSFAQAQAEAQRLEAELTTVRQRLLELAQAARVAESSDETLQRSIRESTSEATRLTKALEAVQGTVNRYGQQLAEAGVDTSKLNAEQERLIATAGRLKGAYDAASDSQTVLGQTVAKANAAQKNGFELQRTSLSLFQRVRGQVLSLTAAYVGLFGVLSEARAVLDTAQANQRLSTQLGVAFGNDPKVVATEMEFVRTTAEKLGVELKAVGAAYGRFAISASSAGLSVADTRQVFESFATTTRVFGLSADDTAGVFRALEQSLGKGKVQAEELRGQIADRLPGAVTTFARALDIPIDQLDKLFEKGAIKAPAAIKLFADEYRKAIAGQVLPASVRFDAEVGRLQTSLFNFRSIVADSGFLESMTTLAKGLSEFLKSAEGQQLARDLGGAFTFVADGVRAATQVLQGLLAGFRSIGEVLGSVRSTLAGLTDDLGGATGVTINWDQALRGAGTALAFLIGALAVAKVAAWADTAVVAARATMSLAVSFATLGGAIKSVLLPALAALLGFELGTWLYENSLMVRKAGAAIVSSVAIAIEAVKGAANIVTAGVQAVVLGGLSALVSAVTGSIQTLGRTLASAARLLGLDDMADKIESGLGQFGAGLEDSLRQSAADARKAVLDETRKMREGIKGEVALMNDAFEGLDAADAAVRNARPSDRSLLNAADASLTGAAGGLSEAEKARLRREAIGGAAATDKEGQRIAKEQAALVASTRKDVGALSLRAAKKEATDLDAALAAVDQQYQTLFDNIAKIEAFNVGEAALLRAQAEAEVDRVKASIRGDFELKAAGDRVKALEAERDAALELQRIRAGEAPDAQAQLIRDQAATTAEYTARLVEATRAEEALAVAQGNVLKAAEARARITRLTAADPERAAKQAELQALQVELQRLTSERDARVAESEALRPGPGSDQERLDIAEQYKAKLTETATAAQALALALGDVTTAANLGALIGQLDVTGQKIAETSRSLQQDFASGFVNAIASADQSFGDFARSFVRNILIMIAQQRVLNALQGSTGAQSFFSTVAGAAVGSNHSGGMAGTGARRMVNPAVFANAARYHSGGIPGLAPNEVPSILLRNEEVLTRDDPRHALNGGKAGGGGVTIVNTIDPGEVASAGLGTPAGKRAFLNNISTMRADIKKVLA